MAPSTLGDIVVRPLTSAEVLKVRELHTQVLPLTYPLSFFTQLLLLPARVCLVAYHSSHATRPIAFISASVRDPPLMDSLATMSQPAQAFTSHPPQRPCIEILTLGVLPAYRNVGLARLLLSRVHQHFYDMSSRKFENGVLIQANVSTSNTPALIFYERMGMHRSDTIRGLYRGCSYGSRDGYLVEGSLH